MSVRNIVLLLAIFAFMSAAGCAEHARSISPAAAPSAVATTRNSAGGAPSARRAAAVTLAAEEPAPASGGTQPVAQVPPSRKLIQKAAIVLQVASVQIAFDSARALAASNGGFVSASNFSAGNGDEKSATLELKIPAGGVARATDALAQLGKVCSRTESGEDVTEQYVDLNSRLRNLDCEEKRLLALLGHADRVSDLLEVEREVSRVRGESEQIQGHLKHVDQLVAYATVDVTLNSRVTAVTPPAVGFWNLDETVAYAWFVCLVIMRFVAQTAIYAVFIIPFVVPVWWLSRRAMAYQRTPGER